MDARLQRRVQRYGWDKASGEYERYWRRQLEPAQVQLLALAALRPGERVLDIACGTGLVTFPAARAVGPSGSVVATDLSQDMVTRAAELAETLDVTNATFERMDAEDLQREPNTFDAALCALGLMYVPYPQKALAEMHRVLRPGGRAVVAVWGARSRCGWAEIFPIVDRRVASEVCPMFFQLGTGDMLQHAMQAAGFVDTRIELVATTLDYASDDEALGAAFAGGPVVLAYSRFDDETRDGAHREYLDSLAAYRRDDGYAVPGEFVVVRGVSR
jgi:ubiquinone/menaquinone biosynthesis C-methylase UbiE